MNNMDGYRLTRPRESFEKLISALDVIEHDTRGIITPELGFLKETLTGLPTYFDDAASGIAIISAQKGRGECAKVQENVLSRIMPGIMDELSFTPNWKEEYEIACIQYTKLRESSKFVFDEMRDNIAEKVLSLVEKLCKDGSIEVTKIFGQKLEQARDQFSDFKSASSAEIQALKKQKKELLLKLVDARNSVAKKERDLKDEYGGLKKSYYRDLHRLVEERVRDEKLKLGDRLSKAEAKAMQHAKILGEKEALEARVLQESREKALLKQTKVELEHKYRDRDDEAKALREGYVQLSNNNQALQTEKAVLQADYDELKEHGKPPEEFKYGSEQCHFDQPAVVRPLVSSTTAFDRQAAELQHLDGLVAIWQTTLGNATAEINESADKKKILDGKIQDAEQQLKKLKSVSPSKTHRAPNTKSNLKDAHKEQVVVDGTLAGQDVPKASVNTPGALPKARVAAEEFPALRAPAVPKTTPSNTWKSLRLVDIPKEDTKGARKKFN
jgi:hypothetical protein